MNETWLPIPSLPGYLASNAGRVRSIAGVVVHADGRPRRLRGVVLSQWKDRYGYFHVQAGGKRRSVHSAVLEAFSGPCPDGMQACHNDGDQTHNQPENLRWDTPSSNMHDRVLHRHDLFATKRWWPKKHQEACVMGHPLALPNLVKSNLRRGTRACLACHRGRGRWRRARLNGATADVRQFVDACYAEIGAAA